MRTILQAQAAECGLACLAMVADHHGLHVDMAEMRHEFGLSLQGARLARLVEVARQLGLQPRPLRLELEDLGKLRLPCVLHWNQEHFVVLSKVWRNKAVVVDPGLGERRLRITEVSQHFSGVALELSPGADFTPRKALPAITIGQLTGPVRGLVPGLVLLLGLSLLLQFFVVLAPFYMQWVIDQALLAADRDLLLILAIGFAMLLALQVGTSFLRGWTVVQLSARLGLQWVGNVFAHILRLPMSYFETRHLGDVVSRAGAVQSIQRTLTTSAVEAVVDGVMTVAALAMMLAYSPTLAIVSAAVVVLYLASRAIAYRPFRRATESQLVAGARQQGHLLESLRGMQSLKVASGQGQREAGYRNLLAVSANAELRLARLGLGFSTVSQALFGAERVLVVWLGARMVLDGQFSVGMLVAYLAYKDQFATRVAGVIDKWLEFRMLRLHGERLADIVLTPPERDVVTGAEEVSLGVPGLQVEDLGFRYAEGEPWILRNCSFRLSQGESVAIVGPSGCGKSTLVKLLLGLLTPTEGRIRVDGEPLGRIGMARHRANVGAVMQDDHLFAGSLADNIAFGDPEPDMSRVEAAATLAALQAEIRAMPMGYHTLIGDMGSSLSGGQRQRVILARALYRNPRFLFLDEATSHLDVEREREVNAAIGKLSMTRLIIAHRPETIASADRVLVMHSGKIVADHRTSKVSNSALAAAIDCAN